MQTKSLPPFASDLLQRKSKEQFWGELIRMQPPPRDLHDLEG